MAATEESPDGKTAEFFGYLPENVQTLAATFDGSIDKEIPARYLRPDEMAETVVLDGCETIPIIDFSRLLDINFSQAESAKLDFVCRNWGFFQLINHQIDSELIERMKSDVVEFFKLPLTQKQAYSVPPGHHEGYGQFNVISKEQKLDWSDVLHLFTQPIIMRNMNLWPTNPSSFAVTLDQYSTQTYEISKCLLGFIVRNMGVDLREDENSFKNWIQTVRMNYYPPCPQHDKALGVTPHSDTGAITLLLEVSEVQGLQIRKNGVWLPIKPLPGALIVNTGDVIEIFSNGKYKSVEHRAVVNAEKERISIGAFSSPSVNDMIGPLPQVAKESEARYITLDQKSYQKLFFSSKLDGKSFLDKLKIKK